VTRPVGGAPDRAPHLEHHDARTGILVTSYLPGELVEGTLAEADPDVYRRGRAARFTPRTVPLYFTHGDYQPRNWVIDNGRVGVIDFGRGQDRSWVSDLVRLQNQQFTGHPERNRAFMAGLSDPDDACADERPFCRLRGRRVREGTGKARIGQEKWQLGLPWLGSPRSFCRPCAGQPPVGGPE
jgi:hypothetical protein